MLAFRSAAHTEDACDVAVRERRRSPAGFPKLGCRGRWDHFRLDDANQNRALGLLIFGRPDDALRVLVDLINDLESSPNYSPWV